MCCKQADFRELRVARPESSKGVEEPRGKLNCHALPKASGRATLGQVLASRKKLEPPEWNPGGSFLLVHAAASKPISISCGPRHEAVKLHGLLGLALCLLGFLLRALSLLLASALFLGGLL